MKFVFLLVVLSLSITISYAANQSIDVNTTSKSAVQIQKTDSNTAHLPKEVLTEIEELDARMRFFLSIGFHKHSRQKRDEIVALYKKYKTPVPKKYLDWMKN